MISERRACADNDFNVHGLEESCAHQMRQPSRMIGLVGRERLERLIACPLSMHTTGRPRRLGAFANSSAIALLVDAVLVLLADTAQNLRKLAKLSRCQCPYSPHEGERPACAR